MNPNEKIFVKAFECTSIKDDYIHGEDLEVSSSWTGRDLSFDFGEAFDSIEDALKAVCDANFFDFRRECWSCEDGHMCGSMLVNDENYQASADEINRWKKGKTTLYSCNIKVELEVAVKRPLTASELKSWH